MAEDTTHDGADEHYKLPQKKPGNHIRIAPLKPTDDWQEPPPHDRSQDAQLTGIIELTLTTLEPLHVGAGTLKVVQEELVRSTARDEDGQLVIPRSSLRGAILASYRRCKPNGIGPTGVQRLNWGTSFRPNKPAELPKQVSLQIAFKNYKSKYSGQSISYGEWVEDWETAPDQVTIIKYRRMRDDGLYEITVKIPNDRRPGVVVRCRRIEHKGTPVTSKEELKNLAKREAQVTLVNAEQRCTNPRENAGSGRWTDLDYEKSYTDDRTVPTSKVRIALNNRPLAGEGAGVRVGSITVNGEELRGEVNAVFQNEYIDNPLFDPAERLFGTARNKGYRSRLTFDDIVFKSVESKVTYVSEPFAPRMHVLAEEFSLKEDGTQVTFFKPRGRRTYNGESVEGNKTVALEVVPARCTAKTTLQFSNLTAAELDDLLDVLQQSVVKEHKGLRIGGGRYDDLGAVSIGEPVVKLYPDIRQAASSWSLAWTVKTPRQIKELRSKTDAEVGRHDEEM